MFFSLTPANFHSISLPLPLEFSAFSSRRYFLCKTYKFVLLLYLNIVLLGVSNRLKSCFGQSTSENLKHKRPVYVGGALLYR